MAALTKQQYKEMLKKILKATKSSGSDNKKALKQLVKIAVEVENLEDKFSVLSDSELRNMTEEFKERLRNGETLDGILPDAFAVCREASKRVLHQRHYFVQVIGGIALHQGRIAELQTGEGKTLMETLPAYLNALSGLGVHIVTVNDYLAKRDAEWMGKIFKFLGLTVGVTLSKMRHSEKTAAYHCDITYGTNNEYGFDYLRDNMARSKEARVQRPLNFAIIDEADSILIDEARTPLIISGPSGKSSSGYGTANRFAATLEKAENVNSEGDFKDGEEDGDYIVNAKDKSVRLTDKGVRKAEKYFNVENLADAENIELNYYINNALKAHALMKRDKDYIVERGQVVIVDEYTGRKMEGRRYNGGLHQAIEAKENVVVKEENQTLATITFQNYFRLYRKMSGMTGTAKTEEKEFNTIYNVDVVVIPTNLALIRIDNPDLIYTTTQGKLTAIVEKIKEIHSKGQPILVGTVSVEKSEELSQILTKNGIKHNVLNAKNHEREAEIVAQAGRLNAVTIATNMAGRGTDILLGGNAEFLAKEEMRKKLGYTDEQIDLATSFAEGDSEQKKLQSVYSELLKYHQQQTNAEKAKVLEVGGLFVLGTERHDSRRIDNQLRGRAGRQGDKGESLFFLSAEDDMLRIFGGMLQTTLSLLRVSEGTPIESKLISRQIETAQRTIEGKHFSARKNVLKFDDVNNEQRNFIYKKRNQILEEDNIHKDICAMADTYALKALEEACGGNESIDEWDYKKLNDGLKRFFPLDMQPVVAEKTYKNARDVHSFLKQHTENVLNALNEKPLTEESEIPFNEAERFILLSTIDRFWMQHLEDMDSLKTGIGLQSIGHHDPFQVFKREGFRLFDEMNRQIELRAISQLFFTKVRKRIVSAVRLDGEHNTEKALNLGCPCGSGKKYKSCCYTNDLKKALEKAKAETENSDRPLTKQEEYALKRQQRKQRKTIDN